MKEHMAYNTLCKIDDVEEIYPLFGDWDLIVKISAEDEAELKDKILNKIKPVEGILATKTLIGY